MPAPKHVFNPPFNIVRSSHATLGVTDLVRSKSFYVGTLGLWVEDEDTTGIYLRGLEERQHHSLVLRKSEHAVAHPIGFKVASEEDLDKAAHYFKGNGIAHTFVERAYQGRTLEVTDPLGMPIELYSQMEQREPLLRQFEHYKGVRPQRLDHFNVFAPDVQGSLDFYVGLGFRLTEYVEEDGPEGRIAGAWIHRKGNVHDLALMNGHGPRLHHLAYWVPTPLDIIHLCDVMATNGHLAGLERGPGRHGISNAFFLYVRCPDGHRVELYTSDYQTMDHDHAPVRWSIHDPRRQTLWGHPAPRSWLEEGSRFADVATRDARFQARAVTSD